MSGYCVPVLSLSNTHTLFFDPLILPFLGLLSPFTHYYWSSKTINPIQPPYFNSSCLSKLYDTVLVTLIFIIYCLPTESFFSCIKLSTQVRDDLHHGPPSRYSTHPLALHAVPWRPIPKHSIVVAAGTRMSGCSRNLQICWTSGLVQCLQSSESSWHSMSYLCLSWQRSLGNSWSLLRILRYSLCRLDLSQGRGEFMRTSNEHVTN